MGQAVYVCLRTIISSFEGDHPRIASDELVRKILVVSASEAGIFGMPSTIRLSGGASESLCAKTDPAVRLNIGIRGALADKPIALHPRCLLQLARTLSIN